MLNFFALRGNYDIPTITLTGCRSASELPENLILGTDGEIRTPTSGFGDRYATVTSHPYFSRIGRSRTFNNPRSKRGNLSTWIATRKCFIVRMTGLEPATPASQMRYSKPTELHPENYLTLRLQVSRYSRFSF